MKERYEMKVIGSKNRELGESRALAGAMPKFLISKRHGVVVQHLRKSVYSRAYLVGALGGDIVELAKKLGVKRSTMARWMDGDKAIEESFLRGLDTMKTQIEVAAYKKAQGYTAKRKSVVVQTDKNGAVIMKTTTNTDEHIQPDGGMIKWLLRHRSGNRWPESGDGGGVKVIINMDGDDKDL